ncbi:MAG: T9SS type A sorting domain-containing protein [Candidatus Cloacimonetes bacterium]|jgi:hypothetical protein|nr:T9SS type A sorting domain-containing protein [Candidatus Cloacimonadota bacterium]
MFKRIILLISLLGLMIYLQAQALSLTTGNMWFHSCEWGPGAPYIQTNIAIGDTVIDNQTYEIIQNSGTGGFGFYRSDSTKIFYRRSYPPNSEFILCDLSWELDQQVNIGGEIFTVIEKGTMSVFGFSGRQYLTIYAPGNGFIEKKYAETFGQIYYEEFDMGFENPWSQELIGAQIDDISYGTIVSADDLLIEPKATLFQNYPNPFNPETTISFSVTQTSPFVTLEIYNIKGQKIKSLVQNEFAKGFHSVIWNGDNELGDSVSSGIYLYKLSVNGIPEAMKKCLLLK